LEMFFIVFSEQGKDEKGYIRLSNFQKLVKILYKIPVKVVISI